jgi:hypothetical protein
MANSALVYNIENTEGGVVLTIKPGEETLYSDIDLKFYGYGTPMWGMGVDRNAYRLLENFACPSKAALSPPGSAIIPQDENDLGRSGLGINNPVVGQVWYNTTSDLFYYYGGSAWKQLGGVEITDPFPPSNPQEGQIVFDPVFHAASPDNGQIMVYVDGEFISIAGEYVPIAGTDAITDGSPPREMEGFIRMGLNRITNLGNPVDAQDAMTLSYAESIYLNAAGDTITGDMTVTSSNRLIFSDTNDGYDYVSISSNGSTANTLLAIRGSNSTNPATDVTLMEILYNGGRYDLSLSLGDLELPNAQVTQSYDAATKQYVDSAVSGSALPTGTKLLFGSWPLPTGWTLDESANDHLTMIVASDPAGGSPLDVHDLRENASPTAQPQQAGQSDLPTDGSWTIASGNFTGTGGHSHNVRTNNPRSNISLPEFHNKSTGSAIYTSWEHNFYNFNEFSWGGSGGGAGSNRDADGTYVVSGYMSSGAVSFNLTEKTYVAGMTHRHEAVTTSTGGHTHSVTGWRPKYRKMILARKD